MTDSFNPSNYPVSGEYYSPPYDQFHPDWWPTGTGSTYQPPISPQPETGPPYYGPPYYWPDGWQWQTPAPLQPSASWQWQAPIPSQPPVGLAAPPPGGQSRRLILVGVVVGLVAIVVAAALIISGSNGTGNSGHIATTMSPTATSLTSRSVDPWTSAPFDTTSAVATSSSAMTHLGGMDCAALVSDMLPPNGQSGPAASWSARRSDACDFVTP